MNRFIKYVFISSLVLLFAGCAEDIVDIENPTSLSPDVIYSNIDGIESSLPGIYAQGRMFCTWESGCEYKNGIDDLSRAGIRLADDVSPNYYQAYTLTSFNAQNTFIRTLWENLYLGLHKSNLALSSLDGLKISSTEDQIRADAVSGVLYFFRAYFHLQLIQRWDNIVLADHVFNDPSEEIKLAKKEDVYALIISDLETAILLLPEASSITSDRGHVTKGVARLVLAKAAMDVEEWSKAAAAADAVIDDPAYELISIEDVFRPNNYDNKEWIFSWQIARGESQTSMRVRYLPMYDRVRGVVRSFIYGGRPYNRLAPTEYYWSLFDPSDQRLEAWHVRYYTYDTIGVGSTNTEIPPEYVSKGDTVREADFNYVNADGTSCAPAEPGNEYIVPTTKKWFEDGTYGRTQTDAYGWGNVLQYRLADAYILAAEAYFHIGDNQKAADRLNPLRIRAGVPDFAAGDISLQTILDEHAREMGQEGNRYEMLKRLGLLKSQIILGNPAVGDIMQDYHVRWPIPYGFQQISKVPQNEGYY